MNSHNINTNDLTTDYCLGIVCNTETWLTVESNDKVTVSHNLQDISTTLNINGEVAAVIHSYSCLTMITNLLLASASEPVALQQAMVMPLLEITFSRLKCALQQPASPQERR